MDSGATVSGLSDGQHTIDFRSINGWTAESQSVTITSGSPVMLDLEYSALVGVFQVPAFSRN